MRGANTSARNKRCGNGRKLASADGKLFMSYPPVAVAAPWRADNFSEGRPPFAAYPATTGNQST